MRKWINIVIPIILLTAGAVVCVLRWQAWFGMPAEPQWTGDSLYYEFPSFARDSVVGFVPTDQGWQDTIGPESLDILVLGDIHNRLQCKDYDSLAARVPQADALIQIGDWLHRGQEYYHQLLLREWTGSELCGLPVINCPGNHEYSKGLRKTISPVWIETFPQPANGPVEVPGKSYYIDFPSVRIIAIDTNPLSRLVYLTRTLTWLREAMYTAGDRYVVVIMHHPVFSVAKGRFNSLIYTFFRHALGEADLVIAGHDHSYMRRTPFVVLNTAGKEKKQRFRFTPDVVDSVSTYGVLQIENHQSSICNHQSYMRFTVHRLNDGTQIDSLNVKHD